MLYKFILSAFWYIQPQTVLLVNDSAKSSLESVRQATKRHSNQLHLRDLFVDGRQYHVQQYGDGFIMLTTSRQYWRYFQGIMRIPKRTYTSARLLASMQPIHEEYTRICIRSHIRMKYLLDIIYIPAFITSIIIYMPWNAWIILSLSLALLSFSVLYHRFHAAYQANEMLFFIEKVLSDKIVVDLPAFNAYSVIEEFQSAETRQDFDKVWEKFYQNHHVN